MKSNITPPHCTSMGLCLHLCLLCVPFNSFVSHNYEKNSMTLRITSPRMQEKIPTTWYHSIPIARILKNITLREMSHATMYNKHLFIFMCATIAVFAVKFNVSGSCFNYSCMCRCVVKHNMQFIISWELGTCKMTASSMQCVIWLQ